MHFVNLDGNNAPNEKSDRIQIVVLSVFLFSILTVYVWVFSGFDNNVVVFFLMISVTIRTDDLRIWHRTSPIGEVFLLFTPSFKLKGSKMIGHLFHV